MFFRLAVVAAAAALGVALPAQAAVFLTATSSADFDAQTQSAVNPFTRYGSATIQWGRAGTSNWELGVKDANDKLLTSMDVAWAPVANLVTQSGTTPFLTYTSAGRMTTTFTTGSCANATGVVTSCRYQRIGTVTKGADTLWIRGVTPAGAFSNSVLLSGLQLKTAGSTVWHQIDYLNADADGQYVGFHDVNLALGFTLKLGIGYFNNGTYNGIDDKPLFELVVGKYAVPLEAVIEPVGGFGDDGDGLEPAGADLRAAEFASTAAVPEPASWAMLIGGFGMLGGALRRRRAAFA